MIKSIAIVGGFSGFENRPESNDYKFVVPALNYLRQSGIDIAETPDFDCVNFADHRNFLDEETCYDLVFIAHIPNGRNLSWTRMPFQIYTTSTDVTTPSIMGNTIDKDNSPDKWAKRLKNCGADFIASVGGYLEVQLGYMEESSQFCIDFNSVVKPKNDPSLTGQGSVFERDIVSKIYGREMDIPYQWLGIAQRKTSLYKTLTLH